MIKILDYLTLFSAASFFFFGCACFLAPQMLLEFKRYGLAKYRKLVGILQLLGSIGLCLGLLYEPKLQLSAAIGLTVLMLLGFLVRLKIKDSVIQSAPSLIYAVLNATIVYLMLFS